MSILKNHGMTTNTPGSIMLGAGTYYKNLAYSASGEWEGEILGATSGGGKITITNELVNIEVDGALVKVKGLTVKQGGTAIMEVNFAELSTDLLKTTSLFTEAPVPGVDGYKELIDKPHITEGDYIQNLGFVGMTADGSKEIIVIFHNALCTSGLELEGKNKEASVIKATFEAHASINGDIDRLPVTIYYPDLANV